MSDTSHTMIHVDPFGKEPGYTTCTRCGWAGTDVHGPLPDICPAVACGEAGVRDALAAFRDADKE